MSGQDNNPKLAGFTIHEVEVAVLTWRAIDTGGGDVKASTPDVEKLREHLS